MKRAAAAVTAVVLTVSGFGTASDTAPPCIVAAAGDVAGAQDYRTGAAKTAELITAEGPVAVLGLGDLAYPEGTVSDFANYYHPTWGSFRDRTQAVPGNHEHRSGHAGIVSELGPSVVKNRGVNICGWRVILVNPYDDATAAAAFIAADAAAHPDVPRAVVWHAPRYSSGQHGSSTAAQSLWNAATSAGARLVLSGHDHDYERFAPMDADGKPSASGTRQFVSGLGGHEPRPFATVQANSERRFTGQPAVLFLSLSPDGAYGWSVTSVDGEVRDTGAEPAPAVSVIPPPDVPSTLDQAEALLAQIARRSARAPGGSADKTAQIAALHELASTVHTGDDTVTSALTQASQLLAQIALQSRTAPGSSADKTAQIARLHALATTPIVAPAPSDVRLTHARELLAELARLSARAPGGSADKTEQIFRLHALAVTPLKGPVLPSAELASADRLLAEIAARSTRAPGGSADKTEQIVKLHALATTSLS